MVVAIVSFQLPKATTAEEMSGAFKADAPMFQKVPGLLHKYFYVSEDGRRAGGVYVWASRADADRLYGGSGGRWSRPSSVGRRRSTSSSRR
jgi:hypothetical protein